MKVTYLGTTMLLFDDGKDQILFDCHITRPGLFKCLLGKLDTNISVANQVLYDWPMERLKGIFISHTHHDHVLDAPYFMKHTNASLYGSISAINLALGNGIHKDRLYDYHDSMKYKIGDFQIQIIPSIHSIAHWYNNDLGQVIDLPLALPAKKKAFKEGGSFDFYIEHQHHSYLIRPSYNYLEGEFDGIRADVLFLGVGGMSKDTPERKQKFFEETIQKVNPKKVIPVHWDDFFAPLYDEPKENIGILGNNAKGLREVEDYCKKNGIEYIQQMPRTTCELD